MGFDLAKDQKEHADRFVASEKNLGESFKNDQENSGRGERFKESNERLGSWFNDSVKS